MQNINDKSICFHPYAAGWAAIIILAIFLPLDILLIIGVSDLAVKFEISVICLYGAFAAAFLFINTQYLITFSQQGILRSSSLSSKKVFTPWHQVRYVYHYYIWGKGYFLFTDLKLTPKELYAMRRKKGGFFSQKALEIYADGKNEKLLLKALQNAQEQFEIVFKVFD